MGTFTERIRLIFDVDAKGASSGFGKFTKSVREAEGFAGKFSATLSYINAKAGVFAAGAGLALVNWAVKGANEFGTLAKASIDLSKATGLSTEQASRWIAVADDQEVTAEQLVSTLGRIPKTLDSGAWEKYGIATEDSTGRVRESNDILLDALDLLSRTNNTTERAAIGTELFGKSFAALSPLIGKSRAEYEKMLGAVSDGQVVTDAEAAKAERLRLAQDELTDALQDLQVALAGVVTAAAPAIEVVADLTGAVTAGYAGMTGSDAKSISQPLHDYVKAAKAAGGATADISDDFERLRVTSWNALSTVDRLRHKGDEWYNTKRTFNEILKVDPQAASTTLELLNIWVSGAERGNTTMKAAAEANGINRDRLNELEVAYRDSGAAIEVQTDNLISEAEALEAAESASWGLLDAKNALIDSTLGAAGAERAYLDALDDLNTATDDVTTSKDESAEALDRAAAAALRNAQGQAELNKQQAEADGVTYDAEQATRDQIAALSGMADALAPGSPLRVRLEEYIAMLRTGIPRDVSTRISVNGSMAGESARKGGGRAFGGPTTPGIANPVVERGMPELYQEGGQTYLLPAGPGQVTPLSPAGGGGTVINNYITVQSLVPTVETGRMIAESTALYQRRGGN